MRRYQGPACPNIRRRSSIVGAVREALSTLRLRSQWTACAAQSAPNTRQHRQGATINQAYIRAFLDAGGVLCLPAGTLVTQQAKRMFNPRPIG